jgi:hypothetical protein
MGAFFFVRVDFDSKYVDVGEGWAASKMKIVPRSGISLPRALSLKKNIIFSITSF